jgi:hypothetical protein
LVAVEPFGKDCGACGYTQVADSATALSASSAGANARAVSIFMSSNLE